MKDHFKASGSPMHTTGTMKADDPHHLAPEAGHDGGESMHLAPGHTMGGGGADSGGAPPMGGGAMAPMGGGEPEPAEDPNQASGGGEPMGAGPMGGERKKGY